MPGFNFEVYDKAHSYTARKRRGATVTVQPRGLLSFSPDAYEMLGSPKAVVFLVDRDERLIGFKPLSSTRGAGNAYTVRGPGSQRLVSATAVLKVMGWQSSQAVRYPLAEIDGTLCIDLKQPGQPVTSNRKKGGPR